MVRREAYLYCARLIPPGEVHYVLAAGEWESKAYCSLNSYCAAYSPDQYNTCEMCKRCAKRNGLTW